MCSGTINFVVMDNFNSGLINANCLVIIFVLPILTIKTKKIIF